MPGLALTPTGSRSTTVRRNGRVVRSETSQLGQAVASPIGGYGAAEVELACADPSWGNQFRDNTLDGTWTWGALGAFHYFQGDSTTGCSRPSADARRVRTSGNVQTATPCSMD